MASSDADLNLLFGILALHNGFISRDALVRAMSSWIAEKPTPLGQILVRNGDLAPDHHSLMEVLVKAHLKQHRGDAAESLAAVNTTALAKVLLKELPDADVHASLVPHEPAAGGTRIDDEDGGRAGVGTPTSSGGRFRILRAHASGALGEVFLARDEELHRDVALKQIKLQYGTDVGSRTRFVAEAEITGNLEHPGVVPVYGLGLDEFDRPYYAMRFIKGDTLKQAIDRFHSNGGPADPGERSLELRRLLSRFVDVCEAVAYAHSRGVVHRDIKPANVMLGKFGETLVVDWGLAKSVGRGEVSVVVNPEEVTLRPSSSSDAAKTVQGSALGTPAYMSPEQAAGRLDDLRPASDVYSLGATLYTILTGRPAFEGKDLEVVLWAVRRGEFPPPRSVHAGVDRLLEAVCLKAMARHPEDRYGTAEALAEDIEHWLADEPVTAWREPVLRRARRWASRHRTAVTAAAAGLLVALAASVAIAGLQAVAAQREHRLAERERQAKVLAQARLGQVEKANDLLGAVFSDLDPRAEEQGGKPLRAILGERLGQAAASLDGEAIGDRLTVAKLQEILGVSQHSLGNTAEAMTLLTQSCRTREAMLGADHPDTLHVRHNLALAYFAAGRTDEAIKMHEAIARARESKLGTDHPDTLNSREGLANAYWSAGGRTDEAIKLHEAILKTRESALGLDHDDTLTSRNNLALAYLAAGRTDEAIKLHEATIKAEESKLGADHPATLTSRDNLSVAYVSAGRTADAIALNEATLKRVESKLGPDHPTTFLSRNNLAVAYASAGRTDEAIKLHEATLKAQESKLGLDHPNTLTSRNNLAKAYVSAGRTAEAITIYEAALKLEESKLGTDHPDTLISRDGLASAYAAAGRRAEAITLFEVTLKSRESKLGADHPDTLNSRGNLALAYLGAGRTDEAIALNEATLKADESKLGPDHPNTLNRRNNLAMAYLAAGRGDAAIKLYEATLKAKESKLAPDHPDTLKTRINLATAYDAVGRTDEAVAMHEATLRTLESKLGPHHPTTLISRGSLASAYNSAGRMDKAIALDEATLKTLEATLGSDHPEALMVRNNLAGEYRAVGRTAEAIALFEATLKARELKLGPDHPDTLNTRSNLAVCYEAAGEFAKLEPLARESLERARRQFGPADLRTAGVMIWLGGCLVHLERWPEAETALRECLSIREAAAPEDWTTFNTRSLLGEALLGQGRYAEAEPLIVSAHEAIKARESMIPASHRTVRPAEAAARVLRLYQAWGKAAKLDEWKIKLGLAELPSDVFARP